jgi:hypothetical protein
MGEIPFFHLNSYQVQESALMVQRLLELGFSLSQAYSQCLLYAAMRSYQKGLPVLGLNLGVCNNVLATLGGKL